MSLPHWASELTFFVHRTKQRLPKLSYAMRPTKLQVSLNQALSKCKQICDLESLVNCTSARDFNGVNSATALSQLGKLSKFSSSPHQQQPSKPVVDKLLHVAEVNKSHLQPFALANICYGIALGKLTPHIPKFVLEKLSSDEFATTCTGQDISMSLWSLAILHDQMTMSTDAAAVANICKAIVLASKQQTMSLYSFQTLANIVWSLATLQQQDQDEVFDIVAKELCARDWHKIKSQDVANIAWSFASVQFSNPILFEKIANNLVPEMFNRFTEQEMANLVWSCATLEEMWPAALQQKFTPLYAKLETMLVSGDKVYNSRHFAQISFSLAKLRRVSDVPLVACNHVNTSARDVLDVLWAIAMICPLPKQRPCAIDFADRIAMSTFAKVQASSPRQLCLMLWCFACLDVLKKTNVKRVFMQQTPTTTHSFALSHLDLRQLAMVRLAWQQAFPEERSALLDSLDVHTTIVPVVEAIHSSITHQRITNWLRTEYSISDLVEEYVLPESNGILVVDAYIPSLNMVLEFDGPNHYDSQSGDVTLGNKKFKRRMIKRAGYALLSINVKDYQVRSVEDRIKMFEPLLAKVL